TQPKCGPVKVMAYKSPRQLQSRRP
uniref:Uncharacterized protein n=1 Tax=Acrobeloides nanus TaxID=290746 RepID=A0A914DFC2_9BILA